MAGLNPPGRDVLASVRVVVPAVALILGALAGVGCADGDGGATKVSTLLPTSTMGPAAGSTQGGSDVSVTDPGSAEGTLKAAIARDFAAPGLEFTVDRWTVVDGWAGAFVRPADPTMEGAAVLLREDGGAWVVVDGGTGYSREDWIASGAPPALADWFGE